LFETPVLWRAATAGEISGYSWRKSIMKTLIETLMTRMLKRVFLLTTAVALSSTALLAQGHPMGTTPQPPSQGSGNNAETNNNPPPTIHDDPMTRDRTFAKKSLEDGNAVVKMSELAQQNSQRDDVKQFAQKAADDQKQTNGRLEEFAKQLSVAPPTELSRKDQKTVAKLQGLSGAKFDEEYLKAMQKNRQDDLKAYKEETGATQDATLQGVLKQDGTTISQHLETIKTLSQGGK
jgi:putative membrane protein